MESEKTIMAYLAGVMDGDGSFGLTRLTKLSRNLQYRPELQCCKVRKEFLELLQTTFGGYLMTGKIHICKDGTEGQALTTWKLQSSGNVKPALEKLIPYLVIKKDRAVLLLDFINNNPFERGKILSPEILRQREKAYLEIVQLNDWVSQSSKITTVLAKDNTDNELFWAYVAGLMDTDGSFSVKRQMQNKGTDVKNPRYLPVISLGMVDARGINYIRENCNIGKFYVPTHRDTKKGIFYLFGIYTKKECIAFLQRIIPYLRSKKLNAQVLLNFCVNAKNTGYCRAGIPKEELAFRDKCYQILCELNKYGVSKSPLIVLEPLPDNAGGNKEQAGFMPCSLNAVSEETSKDDAVL